MSYDNILGTQHFIFAFKDLFTLYLFLTQYRIYFPLFKSFQACIK